MLISLFIITLIVILVSYNLIAEVRRSNVMAASYQVQTLIELGRSCAMATTDESSIQFSNNKAVVNCQNTINNFEFDNVTITTNLPNDTISFYSTGVVNQGATIDICNNQMCKQVTIGVGVSDAQVK